MAQLPAKKIDEHIAISPDICGGKPRIAGHRITVAQIVIWHDRLGQSADEIASEYDLQLADVYAAMAYYFDHRETIDQSMADSQQWIEELRAKTPQFLRQKR